MNENTLVLIYYLGFFICMLFWFWGGLKSQYYRHGLAYALTVRVRAARSLTANE
jgi:hypothetical protein